MAKATGPCFHPDKTDFGSGKVLKADKRNKMQAEGFLKGWCDELVA